MLPVKGSIPLTDAIAIAEQAGGGRAVQIEPDEVLEKEHADSD